MGIVKFSGTALIKLFGLISMIFVSRYIGLNLIGVFAFTISYVTFFSQIGNLGFSSAHLRNINMGLDRARCNGTYTLLSLISLIIINTLVLASFFIDRNLPYKNYLLLALIIANLEFINKFFRGHFHSDLKIATSMIPRILGRFVQMLTKILTLILVGTLFYVYLANIIGLSLILIGYIYYATGFEISYPSKEYILKYLNFSLLMYMVNVLNTLSNHGLTIMVFYFLTESETGLYFLSRSLSEIIFLFSSSLGLVLFVTLSKDFNNNKLKKIQASSLNFDKRFSLFLLPVTIAFCCLSEELTVFLFGEGNIESSILIPFLSIGFYLASMNTLQSSLLFVSSQFKFVIINQLISLIFLIVTFFYFVSSDLEFFQTLGLGFIGIGFSILSFYFIRFILTRITVFYLYSIKPNHSLYYHWLAGILCFFTINSVKTFFIVNGFPTVITIIISSLLCLLFFNSILLLTKQIGRKEIEYFSNLLDMKKLESEIYTELKIR